MDQLSKTAQDVVKRCAEFLQMSDEELRKEFLKKSGWQPSDSTSISETARNFLEYCLFRIVSHCSSSRLSRLAERSFTSLTFDIMVSWDCPTTEPQPQANRTEYGAKETEDKIQESDKREADTALFYSDLMPMLVQVESSISSEAFIKLAPAIPLLADVVTARFQFQALTESTAERLPYPVYHNFVEELHRYVNELAMQSMPSVEVAEGEIILYVDGTGPTQRVARHIGGKSFSGRLTLTNYALYFESTGTTSYGKALRFDLASDAKQQVKACSAGPWGVPVFDKAVMLESYDMEEALVLEFPELTSSTRRDYWLALIKEVIAVHKFIKKFGLKDQEEKEALARAVLGVLRLHATRECFRVFPPQPQVLLPFTLADELLPRGDYVLEELANSIRAAAGENYADEGVYSFPAAAATLEAFFPQRFLSRSKKEENDGRCGGMEVGVATVGEVSSLESTVQQSTEEAKKTQEARASIEGLRAEGINESGLILRELLSPLLNVWPWFQELVSWRRPSMTALVFLTGFLVLYMELAGYVVSGFFGAAAAFLIWIRRSKTADNLNELVISKHSDHSKSTMDSIASAQQAITQFHTALQTANIILLKLLSLALSKPRKHTNHVIAGLVAVCLAFLLIPLKVFLIGIWATMFLRNIKRRPAANTQSASSDRSLRRFRDWWDTIPAMPVRILK